MVLPLSFKVKKLSIKQTQKEVMNQPKIIKEVELVLKTLTSNNPPENANPLQYSCLRNPMDRGTWWAIVHGITKSWTRLEQLSTAHTHSRSE